MVPKWEKLLILLGWAKYEFCALVLFMFDFAWLSLLGLSSIYLISISSVVQLVFCTNWLTFQLPVGWAVGLRGLVLSFFRGASFLLVAGCYGCQADCQPLSQPGRKACRQVCRHVTCQGPDQIRDKQAAAFWRGGSPCASVIKKKKPSRCPFSGRHFFSVLFFLVFTS